MKREGEREREIYPSTASINFAAVEVINVITSEKLKRIARDAAWWCFPFRTPW